MTYYFGPDIKAVEERLAGLADVAQHPFLWLDFHGPETDTNWEGIRVMLPEVRCLVCIVPSLSAPGVDLVMLYERLSFLVMQPEKVLVCLFCTGDQIPDVRQRELLAAYLVRSDVKTLTRGVYHFSAREVLWSPDQIRHRFYIGLAKKILVAAWHDENANIATYVSDVSEDFLPWRLDMQAAFQTEIRQREEIFATAIAMANFTMDPTEITARYGYGRPAGRDAQRSDTMLELLAPERNSSRPDRVAGERREESFPLFLAMNRPFATLPDVIGAVEDSLPTFYDFPETTSAGVRQFSSELERLDAVSLAALRERQNPFRSETADFPLFQEHLARLPALMDQYARGRGQARRLQREALTRELTGLVAEMRALVDAEVESVRSHPNLLRLDPVRFDVAYAESWRLIFQPLFSLRLASWGSRRFLFPLPPWLPGQIHRHTVIMRRLHELLGETVRLLNLYQYAAISLSRFREDIAESMTVVHQLNHRIERLRRHRDNIVQELDTADGIILESKPTLATERFDTKLPDPEAMLVEMLDASTQKVTQVVQEDISRLGQGSHLPGAGKPAGDFLAFLPCIYQHEDAWKAADTMRLIAGHPIFTKILKLPQAAPSEYVVQCEWEKIDLLSENADWRRLKKEALQRSSTPFYHDAVVRTMPDMKPELLTNWIIETGLAKGMFSKDERQWIGLASDVAGSWLPRQARRLFFQCSPGLDLNGFLKRCDSHTLWALKAWLCHASIADLERIHSTLPGPEMILPAMSPEDIWNLLQCVGDCEPDPVEPHPLSHPFFGQPRKDTVYFMLVDTLDPCLMRLFEAGRIEDNLATRYFPETYAKSLFHDKEELRTLLFFLIFDLCLMRGEDPPFPFKDQDTSAHWSTE